jgi:hypothetical protein
VARFAAFHGRLVELTDGHIAFRWKDYRSRQTTARRAGAEPIRQMAERCTRDAERMSVGRRSWRQTSVVLSEIVS